jgi:hypothetical protein
MIKNQKKLKDRRQLVKEILDDPNSAIERIEMLVLALKNSRKTDERIRIAAELLYLSEVTILNDYLV